MFLPFSHETSMFLFFYHLWPRPLFVILENRLRRHLYPKKTTQVSNAHIVHAVQIIPRYITSVVVPFPAAAAVVVVVVGGGGSQWMLLCNGASDRHPPLMALPVSQFSTTNGLRPLTSGALILPFQKLVFHPHPKCPTAFWAQTRHFSVGEKINIPEPSTNFSMAGGVMDD